MNWQDFIDDLREDAREIIVKGPKPYSEMGGSLTPKDKRVGLLSFKGGTDLRSSNKINMKSSKKAVVYWDPDMALMRVPEPPEGVAELHEMDNVIETFEKL